MKKTKQVLCMIIALITLSACSYVGEPDFNIFMRQFNDANKDLQIEYSKTIKEKQDNSNKYSCFIKIGENQDYLITVYEDEKSNHITNCCLCILKSGEPNIKNIEKLFCSMLYGYKLTSVEKANEIFKKLKLNDKSTYLISGKTEEDFDEFKITIITNEAGIAITVK